MKGMIVGVALLACLPLVGQAAGEGGAGGLVGGEAETQTAHWLRLQREGAWLRPTLRHRHPLSESWPCSDGWRATSTPFPNSMNRMLGELDK